MKRFDVIGLGCCCWDFLGIVEEYPLLDEKRPMSVLMQQGGGLTSTAMVAVARLGGRAAFWGKAGDDEFGLKTKASLDDEGVDTEHMVIVPGAQSQFAFCIAHAGTGKRSIFTKAGTMGQLDPADLDRGALLDCRAIMLDSHQMCAAIQAAQWAREAGIPTVLDMESLRPGGEELLRLAEFAILPEHFVHECAGRDDLAGAAEEMQARIGGTLVVTQGDRGCTAFDGDQVIRQPAFRIEKVIDTTGAGDVFHGAFAYGLALRYGLEENLRFSAAVAALKCRALGGRAGIPTFGEAKALIARGPEPASQ